MLAYYFDIFAPQYGVSVFHMHDPLCLGATFQPDFITWEPAYVDVELSGALTLGETVAFFNNRPDTPTPNIQASMAVDAQRFVQFFLDRVGRAFQ